MRFGKSFPQRKRGLKMAEWKHNELAEDLSFNIGKTPYLDVTLGSSMLNNHKVQRADVLSVKPSYRRFCISIYEIKISRSDFLSDIRSEKWKGYLEHCHRFYFATPEGMVDKSEIPDPAGLLLRSPKGWCVVKIPKVLDTKVPRETLKALLFAKQRLSEREKRNKEIHKILRSENMNDEDFKLCKKIFGEKIAEALKNYDKAKMKNTK